MKDKIISAIKPNRSRVIWTVILSFPIILIITAIITTVYYMGPTLPSLAQLEDIDPKLITKIYDKDSNLVHEFYVEKRIWTSYDSIPLATKQAVMAIEDRTFFKHWGFNVWAIPSAVLESLSSGKRLRGASTLTQQLAKLLFLTPERSIIRKIKEALTAVRIEQTYTKEEILEFYLNQVYLGGGTYGFQAAAQMYFGRPLSELNIPETATLAGMLQRPEGYRPDRHPQASLDRRNTVLYAMRDAGYITNENYQTYIKQPLQTAERSEDGPPGPYYIEEVRKYLERKYGESSLYADGVSVYTTLDSEIQRFADSVVQIHLKRIRNKLKYRHTYMLALNQKYKMSVDSVVVHFDSIYSEFEKDYLSKDTSSIDSLRTFPDSTRYRPAQIAMVLIENDQGAIRALVGGSNFNLTKFNRATQSFRQPGSAFKPFVYATAMDNGASPCDSVNDQPITIPDPEDSTKFWRPSNYERKFEGFMTYRRALALSKNLPAIQIGMQYGLSNVVSYSRKFGLTAPLSPVPSLAIGSIGATLMEMTSAFTVFPNMGTRIEPYMVESVIGRNGDVFERNMKVEHEVIKRSSAYLMVSMLQLVNTGGTAARIYASGFTHPSGGKTGTTNDYTDAWYIGFTKQYTMGVWVGTDANMPMGPGHTGGQDAMPYWLDVMTELHKDKPKLSFKVPPGVTSRPICNHTGKVAGEFCSPTTSCLFSSIDVPDEVCDGNHLQNKNITRDASLFGNSSNQGSSKPKTRRLF